MLLPVSPPAACPDGTIEEDEQVRFVTDVLHAVGLYRAVLEALNTQPNTRLIGVARVTPCDERIGARMSHSREHQ
jgi:hypothetical protein